MSDKLSPKPVSKDPLYSWNVLNTWLQNSFKSNSNTPRSMTIIADEFEMSVDEIVAEGKKAGYQVTVREGNIIDFE